MKSSTDITPSPNGPEFLEAARRYFEFIAVGNLKGARDSARRAAETCPVPQMAEGWAKLYQAADYAIKPAFMKFKEGFFGVRS